MNPAGWPLGLGLAAFLATLLGTRALIPLLGRHLLDRPNARSSHRQPVPRGGGLAVLAAVLAALALDGLAGARPAAPGLFHAMAGAVLLMALSFADDLRDLPAWLRLPVHGVAVAVGLWPLAAGGAAFAALLPPAADLALTGLLWLWFVNLYNFMDGIDGISAIETGTIAGGLAGLALLGVVAPSVLTPALVLTGAAIGFFWWNRHPARIFLGDVGSVPLGYLLGWLMIVAVAGRPVGGGAWMAVALLPLYYLTDATVTLARRLIRGEPVWQAHRQHFYQQAVQAGWSHGGVCLAIARANLLVLLAAWFLAPRSPLIAALVALAAVAALIAWMLRRRPPARDPG